MVAKHCPAEAETPPDPKLSHSVFQEFLSFFTIQTDVLSIVIPIWLSENGVYLPVQWNPGGADIQVVSSRHFNIGNLQGLQVVCIQQ